MSPLYEAKATAVGGRDGHVKSSDGVLDLALAIPKEMGGPGGPKTNPEQLFAAGYSACFESAVQFVARAQKVKVDGLTVTAQVGIGKNDSGVGFSLAVKMMVQLPGVEKVIAQGLINEAHKICPYSNATRNNIPVEISLV